MKPIPQSSMLWASVALNAALLLAVLGLEVRHVLGEVTRRATAVQQAVPPGAADKWHSQSPGVRFALLPTVDNSTIWLGDSITEEGQWGELFGSTLNRGVKGDTTSGVFERIDEVVKRSPKSLVLMIGINDIFQGHSAQEVVGGATRIVHELRTRTPNTRLVLVSVLPIRGTTARDVNAVVRAVNKGLVELAASTEIPFLDLVPRVSDDAGELRGELTYDGVHLRPEGYVVWRDALRELGFTGR